MSFMAGFGAGFSDSWKQGQQRDNEMERDIFKLTFDQYIKNQDADKSDLKKEKEDARAAASIVKMLGNVEDPKATMAQAYEFLRAGWSQDKVLAKLGQKGAKASFSAQEPTVAEGIGTGVSNLDTQTQQAVDQTGVPVTSQRDTMPTPKDGQMGQSQSQSQSQEKSWKDSFMGGLFNSPYSKRDRMTDRAYQKIADTTGQTIDQVRQTVKGGNTRAPLIDTAGLVFTPGKDDDDLPKTAREAYVIAQEAYRNNDRAEGDRHMAIYHDMLDVATQEERAKMAGQGGIQSGSPVKTRNPETGLYDIVHVVQGPPDEVGNPTWVDVRTEQIVNQPMALNKLELEAEDKLKTHLKDELIGQNNARAGLSNILYSAKAVSDIASQNHEALTYYTSAGSNFLTKLYNEGKNIISVTEALLPAGKTGKFSAETFAKAKQTSDQTIASIENQVNEGKIERVAADAAKIRLHNVLMAYEVGMAYEQTGARMSEAERAMFTEVVSGDVTIQRQLEILAELTSKLENNFNNRARNMFGEGSTQVQEFIRRYNYNPLPSASKTFEESISDEGTREAYNIFKGFGKTTGPGKMDGPIVGSNTPPGQMAQPQGIRIPRSKAEMLANNPTPENIELFKQAFPQVTDEMIQEILNKTRGE